MIYLQLFFSFLQIGMFSFGGGYAAMPLIQEQVVSRHGWLDMGEFTNLITISQMTPAPSRSIPQPLSEPRSPESREQWFPQWDVFCLHAFW